MILSKINNFDLLRLLAALQVVFLHAYGHLKISRDGISDYILEFISFFPGVPIFFTISGFLIYWTFDRNPHDKKNYFRNRFLRLYPALWICFLCLVIAMLFFKTMTISDLWNQSLLPWVIAQLTIGQFYTADLLRSFGVGSPNGSLWTITVELQFYLIVPFIYFLLARFKNLKSRNILLFTIAVLSIFLNYSIGEFMNEESIPVKLIDVTLLPYLYNFIIGILIYNNFDRLKSILVGKFWIWFIGFIVMSIVLSSYLNVMTISTHSSIVGYFGISVLSLLIISAAFTNTNLSEKLIKKNDISYGVYIYHMIIVNIFVELGLSGRLSTYFAVIVLTILCGYLSWIIIERPFLKLKKNTNRQL